MNPTWIVRLDAPGDGPRLAVKDAIDVAARYLVYKIYDATGGTKEWWPLRGLGERLEAMSYVHSGLRIVAGRAQSECQHPAALAEGGSMGHTIDDASLDSAARRNA